MSTSKTPSWFPIVLFAAIAAAIFYYVGPENLAQWVKNIATYVTEFAYRIMH
jgi:hypothetical protein